MIPRYCGPPNVQEHTAVDSRGQGIILHDRDALVRSIGRMFEKHDGGPVIREVFGKRAGCTGPLIADVTRHRSIKGIASHDLMEMG